MAKTQTLTEKAPHLAMEWHPEKNGKPASAIPYRSNTIAWWLCQKGHEFKASPDYRQQLKDPTCKTCLSVGVKFPHLLKEMGPSGNDGIDLHKLRPGSDVEVWWVCKKKRECGHVWKAKIQERTRGRGCPGCGHKVVTIRRNLAAQYPRIAREWLPEKNKGKKAKEVMSGSNQIGVWTCFDKRCNHQWKCTVVDRVGGYGCIPCLKAKRR